MKLAKNFSLAEFAQPARHGFEAEPYPERWIDERLRPLCEILQRLRDVFGVPVRVLSGYRSEAYNRKISGARHSQHVQGRAADIVVERYGAERIYEVLLTWHRNGVERLGGLGLYPSFVHVDVRPGTQLAAWRGARKIS